MITIPATTASSVRHCVLVKITINTSTYTLANTYGPIEWDSVTYTGLGHFLGFAEIQDDQRATNSQLQMSLSGIPKDPGEAGLGTWTSYVSLILNTNIKGSRVEIYRAFFNQGLELVADNVSLRYSGYISNYTITDSTDINARQDTYTCVVNLSSVQAILERKITGRRTNATDQKALYPIDTGMDNVVAISNTAFDFGKPYSASGTGGGAGSGGVSGGGGGTTDPFYYPQDLSGE
jgi:hypothetical protein